MPLFRLLRMSIPRRNQTSALNLRVLFARTTPSLSPNGNVDCTGRGSGAGCGRVCPRSFPFLPSRRSSGCRSFCRRRLPGGRKTEGRRGRSSTGTPKTRCVRSPPHTHTTLHPPPVTHALRDKQGALAVKVLTWGWTLSNKQRYQCGGFESVNYDSSVIRFSL